MDKDSILRAAVQAAEQMDGNQRPGPAIPPQPVPTAVQLSTVQSPSGEKFVVISITTPVGQSIYFIDPESADKMADGLKETSRLSRTGLEIAR